MIFHQAYFGGTSTWRNSTVRTWLNSTFYPGFSSDFKSRMLQIKYNSQKEWYNDDYIILLSFNEVNNGGTASAYSDNEGLPYPIFTNDTSRKKYAFGGDGSYNRWWTRSRTNSGKYNAYYVSNSGSLSYGDAASLQNYLAPLIRVQ